MSIEDFEKMLGNIGTEVGSLDLHLLEIGGQIVNEMKLKAPYKTGSLKGSIFAFAQNNVLRIKMLEYGAFQNYGVIGTKNNRNVKTVQFGIEIRPRNGEKYAFRDTDTPVGGSLPFGVRLHIRREGLAPKDFFNLEDIETKIATEIQKRLDNLT